MPTANPTGTASEAAAAATVDVAWSALIVPFRWPDAGAAPASIAAQLEDRRWVRASGGAPEPLWEVARDKPNGVIELNRGLQALFGAGDEVAAPWAWRRLRLASKARDLIFTKPALVRRQAGETVAIDGFAVDKVELVIFPLGVGLLVLTVDWRLGGAAVGEVLERLHLARHVRFEGALAQWHLAPPASAAKLQKLADAGEAYEAHRACLGPVMHGARYLGEAVDLQTVASWLILGDAGTESSRAALFGGGRYAQHHTVVQLAGGPPSELDALMWRLRRGYNEAYRVPSVVVSDVVMVPRSNRVIGVSREGTACVTWREEGSALAFESDWHRRFLGVYLHLHLHAQGERLALERLAERVARQVLDVRSAEDLGLSREALRSLILDVVRYTSTLTSDDCGGLTEYVELFQAVRQVYRIEAQRAELRAEVAELSALADAAHRERVEAFAEEAERLERASDERERKFERFIAGFGGVFLPLSLATAVFGMNITGAENFAPEVVATGLAGAVGLGSAAVFWARRALRPPPAPRLVVREEEPLALAAPASPRKPSEP